MCTKGNIITRLTNHPQLAGHPALASRPKECRNALDRYVKAGYLQASKLASAKRGAGAESSYSLTKSGARLLQTVEAKWAATIQQPAACEMNQHGATSGESSPTVASGPLVPSPRVDSTVVDALVPDVLTPVAAVSPVRSSNVADAVLDFFEGTRRASGIATAGSCSSTALRPRIMETAADAFFGGPTVAAGNSNGSASGESQSPERSETLLCPTTHRDGPPIRKTTKTLRELRRRESKTRASITELSISAYASLRGMAEDDVERLARRVTEQRKEETKSSTGSVETQAQAKQLKWVARRAAKRLAIESAAEVGRARIVGQEESALSKLERRANRDALAVLVLLEDSHRVAIAGEEEMEFMDWVKMERESKLPREAMSNLRGMVDHAMLTVPKIVADYSSYEGLVPGLSPGTCPVISAEQERLLREGGLTAEAVTEVVAVVEVLVQRLRDGQTEGAQVLEVARRMDHFLGGVCPVRDGNRIMESGQAFEDVVATWDTTCSSVAKVGQQFGAAWSRVRAARQSQSMNMMRAAVVTTSEKARTTSQALNDLDFWKQDISSEVLRWSGKSRWDCMAARLIIEHTVNAAQLEAVKVAVVAHQISHFLDNASPPIEDATIIQLTLRHAETSLAISTEEVVAAAALWSQIRDAVVTAVYVALRDIRAQREQEEESSTNPHGAGGGTSDEEAATKSRGTKTCAIMPPQLTVDVSNGDECNE